MLKEDEKNALEELIPKVEKLLNARDNYSVTFVKPYLAKDWRSDIQHMVSNIGNDFPLFMNTKLERITGLWHQRYCNLHKIIKLLRNDIYGCHATMDSMQVSIQDMCDKMKKMNDHDDHILTNLLWLSVNAFDNHAAELVNELVYRHWKIDIIINAKIDDKIPLNDIDNERIKELTELVK